MSLGCASTAELMSQYSTADQARFKGTEPGWHVLSPYFAVEIRSNSSATFYYSPDPQNSKVRKPIGKQYMYWLGVSQEGTRKFGPRENAYVVSTDGQSLLYFRDPHFFSGNEYEAWGNSFRAELYLYRHGLGDSLIAKGISHWVVSSRSPVPADAVIYAEVDKSKPYSNIPAARVAGETIVKSIGEFPR